MTNVKLKLMFFILNAVLSRDTVQARPPPNLNATRMWGPIGKWDPFTFPVEPDDDTLVVASDVVTPNEARKYKTQIDDIVNSEQYRDVDLSKTENNELAFLGLRDHVVEGLDKQIYVSNALLEDIIDSETEREEDLGDIEYRSDEPNFQFLRASQPLTGTAPDRAMGHGDSKLNKTDRNVSDVMNNLDYSEVDPDRANRYYPDERRKIDYVELVELLKPIVGNKSAYHLANMTSHEVDNDLAPDTSFTDLQTLILACFGTLLPLLTVLFATLAIRCMCRRWCPGWCRKPTGSSVSESSEKHDTNQQLKDDGTGITDGLERADVQPANGSIFTMTLKNNHLIVETEERNDITKNGRETKMKYSPDNDGIFVVEVQQSAAYRPNKSTHSSPPHDPQISTNQALIHRVPEELERRMLEEDNERSSAKFEKQALALSSTGLSISDLSMSSIGSHNVSYSYGSQMGYEQGPFGYPVYAGYEVSKDDADGITHDNSQEPLIGKTPTDPDKPVVTAAIFKQDSIIGSELQGPGYCIEGSSDGPLLSDVQAREYSLQHLHDQRDKKMENGVAVAIAEKARSPEKKLNRAGSLPLQMDKQSVSAAATVEEGLPLKDAGKSKRASIPTVRAEVYDSVKEAMLTGSPKFEKLKNEVSPEACFFDNPPPMITITEESESGKSDSTS
ncbi:unnamed protein product, partial [Iphiclides podalirius]